MAKQKSWALVGSDTLMGREVREIISGAKLDVDLKLIAGGEEAGTLTALAGEAAVVTELTALNLGTASVVFLAGTPDATRKALGFGIVSTFIDLTHTVEARPRAPMAEMEPVSTPPNAVYVIAHPAAIALALVMNRLHSAYPLKQVVVTVFEPASERGAAGIEELQQQTVNLLSFKSLPKKVFDAQLGFNVLARYGEEASVSLKDAESRMERDLAALLRGAPAPSLRLIQAPVFHGYSFSVWMEFEGTPTAEAIEQALVSGAIDVRGPEFEPPSIAGIAGVSGVAVGAVEMDRGHPRACWLWLVTDNLRLAAENALALAGQVG